MIFFSLKLTRRKMPSYSKKTSKDPFLHYSPTCPKTVNIINIDPALKCLEEHKLPMTELKTALMSAVEMIMRISLDMNAL